MNQLVSVLMSVKNAESYICDSINSILLQTHADLELIIVDDHSTDSSVKIINSYSDYRIRLVSGYGQGVAAAYNLALSYARGNLVCCCDADDFFTLDRLETQSQWLSDHPEAIALAGAVNVVDRKGELISSIDSKEDEIDISAELKSGEIRTHIGCYMFRRESLENISGFREFFQLAEDIDMQFRLAETGIIFYKSNPVYSYRLHGKTISQKLGMEKKRFFEQFARDCLFQRNKLGLDDLQIGIIPEIPQGNYEAVNFESELVSHLIEGAKLHQAQGKIGIAVVQVVKAISIEPANLTLWRCLVQMVFVVSSRRLG